MAEIPLKTAKYFESAEENEVGQTDAPMQPQSSRPGFETAAWERASKWISLVVGGAVAVCIVGILVTSLTGIHLPKSASPIDLWLWFGGAKSDQRFEKFVHNVGEGNQNEWEERYRQSPMYQFKDMPAFQFNQSPAFQFNTQSLNYQPQQARHK